LRRSSINNILLIVGLSAFVVTIIDLAAGLGLPLEALDIAMLAIFVYGLDLPRMALGQKLPIACTVPFVAIAIIAYVSFIHHLPNIVYTVELFVLYPIAIYVLDKKTRIDHTSSKLAKTYQTILNNQKKADPMSMMGYVKLFYGLRVISVMRLSKLLALAKLFAPPYFGVFAFALVLAAFDSKIPSSAILSTALLLLVAIMRKRPVHLQKARHDRLGRLKAILEDADDIETSVAKSVVMRFMTPMGLIYTFLIGSSIIFMFTASNVLTSASIKVLTTADSFSLFQKIIFPPLLTIGLFPFVALPFIAAAFAVLPKKKLKLMNYWYMWPAYCTFILILVKGFYQPWSWLIDLNNPDEIHVAFFGAMGAAFFVHMLLAYRFKIIGLAKFGNHSRMIIPALLLAFPILYVAQGANFLVSSINLILSCWAWFSGVSIITQRARMSRSKQILLTFSFGACVTAIGYSLMAANQLLGVASIAVAALSFVLLLNERDMKKFGKIVGIEDIH